MHSWILQQDSGSFAHVVLLLHIQDVFFIFTCGKWKCTYIFHGICMCKGSNQTICLHDVHVFHRTEYPQNLGAHPSNRAAPRPVWYAEAKGMGDPTWKPDWPRRWQTRHVIIYQHVADVCWSVELCILRQWGPTRPHLKSSWWGTNMWELLWLTFQRHPSNLPVASPNFAATSIEAFGSTKRVGSQRFGGPPPQWIASCWPYQIWSGACIVWGHRRCPEIAHIYIYTNIYIITHTFIIYIYIYTFNIYIYYIIYLLDMVCSYHQFSHGYKYVSLPPGQLHFPAIRPQVLMCTILLLLWSSNVETLLEATHTYIYI